MFRTRAGSKRRKQEQKKDDIGGSMSFVPLPIAGSGPVGATMHSHSARQVIIRYKPLKHLVRLCCPRLLAESATGSRQCNSLQCSLVHGTGRDNLLLLQKRKYVPERPSNRTAKPKQQTNELFFSSSLADVALRLGPYTKQQTNELRVQPKKGTEGSQSGCVCVLLGSTVHSFLVSESVFCRRYTTFETLGSASRTSSLTH